MCGIVGGWVGEDLSTEALEEALRTLVHRGPDDQGILRNESVVLAMRRLSIIDVEGGRQPIDNEDGSVAVVCNGEIYNYRELTSELEGAGHDFRSRSDTEVLVHLYEELGTGLCERLRGMFAFALWDEKRGQLLLARDRLGQKPLYYTRTPAGGLLFASELKAIRPLARAVGVELSVRDQSVYDYLSLGTIPQPATIYEGVFALEPGCWLRFDGERLVTRRYWDLAFVPKTSLGYAEALEQTRTLVAEAVRLRLRSDLPVGAFLSGGVDSSVITYEASRQLGGALSTFTVAVDDPELDESPVAARTARALGVENTTLPLRVAPLEGLQRVIRQYDQPFADSSAIPSLEISRLAREHVTVILTGDGGDEVFAGYRRYVAARAGGVLPWLPGRALSKLGTALGRLATGRRRRSLLGFSARFLRGLGLPPGERYLVWLTDMLLEQDKARAWARGPQRPTEEWVESQLPRGIGALDTQLAGDVRINLLNDQLVKVDIATMAFSLEARSPLLDHEVGEFVARLPDRYRVRRGRPKSLLREAYKGRIPDEVVSARKRGFEIPLRSWLENEFQGVLGDTLYSGASRVGTYLREDFLTSLLRGEVMQERNWAYVVYALLVLELWLREHA